jgi:hypothetical protein
VQRPNPIITKKNLLGFIALGLVTSLPTVASDVISNKDKVVTNSQNIVVGIGREEAFRFARGEEVTTTHGLRARLSRPLEVLVLTDRAQVYGLTPLLLHGDPELITVWQDPDFNKKDSAFYYARVIEIPTPRWTAYEARRFNVEINYNVPMTTQDRAYTSPVWYTPSEPPRPFAATADRGTQ